LLLHCRDWRMPSAAALAGSAGSPRNLSQRGCGVDKWSSERCLAYWHH
jgi:hypothetical protein